MTPTETEYEVSCSIRGKEYGRGIGHNLHSAREQAASEVLNNQEFIENYLQQEQR
jgi:dsRNA-specific ribonuclease